MELGTLESSSRDGRLVIVNRELTRMIPADDIAPTLQAALERWAEVAPRLAKRYDALCRNEIVAAALLTRSLSAGTIIGSGTVSNVDKCTGCACLAERRMIETLTVGAPQTGFLKAGDRIRIEMIDAEGTTIFGAIGQAVEVPSVGRPLTAVLPARQTCARVSMSLGLFPS
jgi:hypothetical protein